MPEKKRRFTLIGEQKDRVTDLKTATPTGVPSSFKSFGNNITYKKGYFLFLYSQPTAGKSEYVIKEAIHLAKNFKWKTVIFAPESGTPADLIASMLHKIIGKPVLKIDGYESATEDEIMEGMKFLNKYFVIINPDQALTMEGLFEVIDEIQAEYPSWVPDNVIIDNHYDIILDLHPFGGRQDVAIENQLAYLRGQMQVRNMYAMVTSHTSDQGKPLTKDGILYYPIPTPEQVRAGRSIYRRAYLLMCLWRCPEGLLDDEGQPYEPNTTMVIVNKAKPSRSAVKGFKGMMYWSWKQDQFLDITDIKKDYKKFTKIEYTNPDY